MNILLLLLLLNIVSPFDLNNYYRQQFKKDTGDPHLKLNNETSPSEIPYITFNETIPNNSTLLKLEKNKLLISCSQFPYYDLVFQYVNDYFIKKQMNSPFFIELFTLVSKILYYKYAPLEEYEKEFRTYNETEDFEYKLSDYLSKYVDVIYSQLDSNKYNPVLNKFNKDIMKKYKIEEEHLASDVYDHIFVALQENTMEKLKDVIKSFLLGKKEEFIKLFNYINTNGFSTSYSEFSIFYLGNKTTSNFRSPNFMCVYLSPITDMIDTKINFKSKIYPFTAYPVFNNSLLLYTRTPLNPKDNNGVLTKYYTSSIESLYFQYNYLFDDFRKMDFNKYIYSKQIDVLIPKDIMDGPDDKKINACQILNICKSITEVDDSTYKLLFYISSVSENPQLINFGRLLFMDETLLNDENIEAFRLFLESFSGGAKVDDENEYLSYLFYYQQLNREMGNYKDFFNDIKNNQKDVEENKDLFSIIELNMRLALMNYNFLLDKMEKLLLQQIMENLQR
jgi:hypothetical protein